MYSPSHRPSMSTTNLGTPSTSKLRRLSAPIPPPAPLDLPEPVPHRVSPQPHPSRSPLRSGVTLDPVTGVLSEDGSDETDASEAWGTREGDRDRMSHHSSSPSITKIASSFAQRVGSMVSSVSPTLPPAHLPTSAELEAEAESQRERSRREAERILTQEAVERRKVEERVLEMLETSRALPTRSQTTPLPSLPPPSPTKEGGNWWTAAKNKLTPNKEKDLTPAQQIVQDAKAREKERKKGKDREWPSNGKSKYQDPSYQQLALPPGARPPQIAGSLYAPSSPGSPSPRANYPPRQLTASPTPMGPTQRTSSPNPHHGSNSIPQYQKPHNTSQRPPTASPAPSTTQDAGPPLYAQFTDQGALDIQETLLTVARRFEKLERWAVGHTRALEERMSDVEKWLVEKERERERAAAASAPSKAATGGLPPTPKPDGSHDEEAAAKQVVREVTIERKTVEVDQEVKREVGEMKEELGELRGRLSELGREMARLATTRSVSPSEASGFGIGRIASPPADTPAASPSPRVRPSFPPQDAPPPSAHAQSPSTYSIAQSEAASIVSTGTGASSRTKLPYPSGDYTSQMSHPESRSPPSVQNYSANNATSSIQRTRPVSYAGRPVSPGNLSAAEPPVMSRRIGAGGSPALAAPSGNVKTSVTPPSRKRYTVALGQRLSSSSSSPSTSSHSREPQLVGFDEKHGSDFGQPLFTEAQTAELQTAFFTDVAGDGRQFSEGHGTTDQSGEQIGEGREGGAGLKRQETIGTTPITLSRLSISPPPSQNSSPTNKATLPRSSPSNPRVRAQSTYGVPGSGSGGSLSSREDSSTNGRDSWHTARSRSIDRVGLGIDVGRGDGNLVDPLVVRKKDGTAGVRSPITANPAVPRGRVPFGDLLAFFDPDKQ